MVAPRTLAAERTKRHHELIKWDSLLHETLAELREVLAQIKELDRTNARQDPPEDSW